MSLTPAAAFYTFSISIISANIVQSLYNVVEVIVSFILITITPTDYILPMDCTSFLSYFSSAIQF